MLSFETSSGFGGGMSPLMIALIAVFALLLVGGIGRALFIWIRNNNSPRQTVDARVVCLPVRSGGVLPCGATGRWIAAGE